eukprot:TRINITY_DN82299_c0_g1_i1.p2 TRINITY_DN82299_c0_g1~~TRINITY_DN82299_c0_g1_i1.p2  ORF type:complete len:129 (+),score=41.33 TRINITY_DN82299_c0_g1_i1:118-504(+)
MNIFKEAVREGWEKYVSTGSPRLHLLDLFSLFCFVVGLIQLVYCFLVGTFPFNSFLSGFFAAVGSGFLTIVFRRQMSLNVARKSHKGEGEASKEQKEDALSTSSVEQSLMEYLFCEMVLFVCVWSFIG